MSQDTAEMIALRSQVADLQTDLNRAIGVLEGLVYSFEHTVIPELAAQRKWADELADTAYSAISMLHDERVEKDRLERQVRRLKCILDDERSRRRRANAATPPEGIPAVLASEHHVAYESNVPPPSSEPPFGEPR